MCRYPTLQGTNDLTGKALEFAPYVPNKRPIWGISCSLFAGLYILSTYPGDCLYWLYTPPHKGFLRNGPGPPTESSTNPKKWMFS